ncbi:MAG: DUF1266 domain-containing protein, partial [Galactobacter sp.]
QRLGRIRPWVKFMGEALGVGVVIAGQAIVWFIYRAAGRRGERVRSQRRALKQDAKWLASHHQLRWRYSPSSLAKMPEGWALAAGSIHTLCRGECIDVFPFEDPQAEQDMLASSWGVTDGRQLRGQLLSLLQNGHRERFDAERNHWATLSAKDARELYQELKEAASRYSDAAEEFLRFQWVRKNTESCKSIDFLAWDMVRVIMLCRAGQAAGYLRPEEALDTAFIAAHALQERYSS